MGATNRSVFGRQMAEGMLILTLTTIFAVIIDWQLAEAGVSLWIKGIKFNGAQFAATTFITYLIIALVIFLGNLMPARKAMKIQPAEALHDE
jgi:putative ABC transport system permease protein